MDVLFGRDQLPVVISFFVCGVICGAFYDVLRIKRHIFPCGYFILFLDDLLFCGFLTIVFLFNAYSFNNGNIKWYEVPIMIAAFVIYRKTVSAIVIRLCFMLIDVLKRLVHRMLMPVIGLARGILEKVYLYLYFLRKRYKLCHWSFDNNGGVIFWDQ